MTDDATKGLASEPGEKRDSSGPLEAEYLPESLPAVLKSLPAETQTLVAVIAGFFRGSSGPDPETTKIVVQGEMHEESCKLDAFRESLKVRDLQNERDHEFRKKKMNQETMNRMFVSVVALAGLICSLYLIIAKNNTSVGTPLLVGSFLSMGIKLPSSKDKD